MPLATGPGVSHTDAHTCLPNSYLFQPIPPPPSAPNTPRTAKRRIVDPWEMALDRAMTPGVRVMSHVRLAGKYHAKKELPAELPALQRKLSVSEMEKELSKVVATCEQVAAGFDRHRRRSCVLREHAAVAVLQLQGVLAPPAKCPKAPSKVAVTVPSPTKHPRRRQYTDSGLGLTETDSLIDEAPKDSGSTTPATKLLRTVSFHLAGRSKPTMLQAAHSFERQLKLTALGHITLMLMRWRFNVGGSLLLKSSQAPIHPNATSASSKSNTQKSKGALANAANAVRQMQRRKSLLPEATINFLARTHTAACSV